LVKIFSKQLLLLARLGHPLDMRVTQVAYLSIIRGFVFIGMYQEIRTVKGKKSN
jgi:hypothetical protein